MRYEIKKDFDEQAVAEKLNEERETIDAEYRGILERQDMSDISTDESARLRDAIEFKHKIPYCYDTVINDGISNNSRVIPFEQAGPLCYGHLTGLDGSNTNYPEIDLTAEACVFNDMLDDTICDADEDETVAIFNRISCFDAVINDKNRKMLEHLGYVSMDDLNVAYDSVATEYVANEGDILKYQITHDMKFSDVERQLIDREIEMNGKACIANAGVGYNGKLYDVRYPMVTDGLSDKMLIRDHIQNIRTPDSGVASCYDNTDIISDYNSYFDDVFKVSDEDFEIDEGVFDDTPPSEGSIINMAYDAGETPTDWRYDVNQMAKDGEVLTDAGYATLINAINDEMVSIQHKYVMHGNSGPETMNKCYDMIEQEREDSGFYGDESDCPSDLAKKLAYGQSREEFLKQKAEEDKAALDTYYNERKVFYDELIEMDNRFSEEKVVFPYDDCTMYGRGDSVDTDYNDYIFTEYTGKHKLRPFDNLEARTEETVEKNDGHLPDAVQQNKMSETVQKNPNGKNDGDGINF